jgi:arylsulfatase
MLFEIDEPKPGAGGNVTLLANGTPIGEGRLDHTCSMLFTTYAGMDMGRDNGGVVDDAYEDRAPYAFTGTLRNVVFDLKPGTAEVEQALHQATQQAGVGHGAGG